MVEQVAWQEWDWVMLGEKSDCARINTKETEARSANLTGVEQGRKTNIVSATSSGVNQLLGVQDLQCKSSIIC